MRCAVTVAAALALALSGGGCGSARRPPAECPAPACGDGLLVYGETCDDANTIEGDTCSADCARAWAADVWLPPTGKADILFVIDDTRTMCEEQAGLRAGATGFLDGLTASGTVDFHLGVITTTMSTDESGRLQNVPNPIPNDMDCAVALPPPQDCTTGLQNPLPKVLTAVTPDLARTFRCIASVGIDGSGWEAPLAAVERALTAPLVDTDNAGFLRDDALLAVVLIGDEDDCSVCDDPRWDECSSLPSATESLDCALWQASNLTPVNTFVESMRARRATSRLFAAAMIGLDAENMSQGPIFPDVDTVNHRGELTPICTSATGRAVPAPRLESYVRAVAPASALESLCGDYTAELRDVATRIATAATTTSWCLSRAPEAGLVTDETTVTVEDGGAVTTLDAGDFAFESDAACYAGVRLALAVPPPATATVSATYPAAAAMGLACRD